MVESYCVYRIYDETASVLTAGTNIPMNLPAIAKAIVDALHEVRHQNIKIARRAEKAEKERDKLAEGYERRRQELDAQYAEIKKLQADLDAALEKRREGRG